MVLLVEVQRILVILHSFDLTSTDVRKPNPRKPKLDCIPTYATYICNYHYLFHRTQRTYVHVCASPEWRRFPTNKNARMTHSKRGSYLVTRSWNEFPRNHVRSLRVRQRLLPFETTDETTLQRTLQVHERKTQRSVTERTALVKLWHSSRLIWDTWVNSKSSMHITSW